MTQELKIISKPEATGKTEVGSYFVSNYPPFSQWKQENIPHAMAVLNQAPRVDDALGLYIHIPFLPKAL